jgi:hypothetical protein
VEENSLTLTRELECGGEHHSVESSTLTELESETEEIAVELDFQELRF